MAGDKRKNPGGHSLPDRVTTSQDKEPGDKSGDAGTAHTKADALERESEQRLRRTHQCKRENKGTEKESKEPGRRTHAPHTEADTSRIQQ